MLYTLNQIILNKRIILLTCVAITFLSAVISCSEPLTDNVNAIKSNIDSLQVRTEPSNDAKTDSNQINKDKLTAIYIKAIEDFIDAAYQKNKVSFDTLFFGDRKFDTPDDFPDISLPKTIKGVEIVLLSIVEAHGKTKMLYKKTTPIINLMGWVDHTKADFVFVTFYPEFNHKYDCYSYYKIDSKTNEYLLDKIIMEILIYGQDGKASHYEVYQNNKYIGNKAIN